MEGLTPPTWSSGCFTTSIFSEIALFCHRPYQQPATFYFWKNMQFENAEFIPFSPTPHNQKATKNAVEVDKSCFSKSRWFNANVSVQPAEDTINSLLLDKTRVSNWKITQNFFYVTVLIAQKWRKSQLINADICYRTHIPPKLYFWFLQGKTQWTDFNLSGKCRRKHSLVLLLMSDSSKSIIAKRAVNLFDMMR